MMQTKKFIVKRINRAAGLVRDYITTVDAGDAHLLRSYYWIVLLDVDGHVYVARNKGRSQEFLHQIIAGAKPGEKVMHINGDCLDNRKENLLKTSERVLEIE